MRISDWSSDLCSSDLSTLDACAVNSFPASTCRPCSTRYLARTSRAKLAAKFSPSAAHSSTTGAIDLSSADRSLRWNRASARRQLALQRARGAGSPDRVSLRSEETTSELPSQKRTSYAV